MRVASYSFSDIGGIDVIVPTYSFPDIGGIDCVVPTYSFSDIGGIDGSLFRVEVSRVL